MSYDNLNGCNVSGIAEYDRVIERKYSNYNFYFINTRDGSKEIKKIHVYDESGNVITLTNPWFGNIDRIDFGKRILFRREIVFKGDDVFYVQTSGKRFVELYIPNSFAQLKRVASEEGEGLYEGIDIYESSNPLLSGYRGRNYTRLDEGIISRIREASSVTKKNFTKAF